MTKRKELQAAFFSVVVSYLPLSVTGTALTYIVQNKIVPVDGHYLVGSMPDRSLLTALPLLSRKGESMI